MSLIKNLRKADHWFCLLHNLSLPKGLFSKVFLWFRKSTMPHCEILVWVENRKENLSGNWSLSFVITLKLVFSTCVYIFRVQTYRIKDEVLQCTF
ncbi:hypothetical protein VNO77_17376 [Canavalia gladiata]|uniref:Uncharacterized protein n=1 Tax=Canavalia gladiata TaxID=3824 RepID=A0AAN9QIP7_CANGL